MPLSVAGQPPYRAAAERAIAASRARSPVRSRDFKQQCPPMQHIKSFAQAQAAADLAYRYVRTYQERQLSPDVTQKHASLAPVAKAPTRPNPAVVFDIDATLLHDTDDVKTPARPIPSMVNLLNRLQSDGASIALVTARLDDASMRRDTESTLKTLGISGWKHLHLAPESARVNMAAVSHWKHKTRKEIAKKERGPIVLSVGDQWGDLIPLSTEKDIDDMDVAFGVRHAPYLLVRPHDGVTMWGLKLLDV